MRKKAIRLIAVIMCQMILPKNQNEISLLFEGFLLLFPAVVSLCRLNISASLVVYRCPKLADGSLGRFHHSLMAILSYNALHSTKYQKYYKAGDSDVFIFINFNFLRFYLTLGILHNL